MKPSTFAHMTPKDQCFIVKVGAQGQMFCPLCQVCFRDGAISGFSVSGNPVRDHDTSLTGALGHRHEIGFGSTAWRFTKLQVLLLGRQLGVMTLVWRELESVKIHDITLKISGRWVSTSVCTFPRPTMWLALTRLGHILLRTSQLLCKSSGINFDLQNDALLMQLWQDRKDCELSNLG